jgi:protein-tyrosine phosphatase
VVQVLFVCLGNICRSPIAEGVFRELVNEKKMSHFIQCDSAGTAAYHVGGLADRRMRKVAHGHGITLTHHARQLSDEDFIKFDYILAMDESNYENINKSRILGNHMHFPAENIILYRSFDVDKEDSKIVPDPYYDEMEAFEDVYQIVYRCGQSFLNWLIEKQQLNH